MWELYSLQYPVTAARARFHAAFLYGVGITGLPSPVFYYIRILTRLNIGMCFITKYIYLTP